MNMKAKGLRLNLPVALLLLAVLFVAFVRIRLLATPLERDEGEFAYGGQLMLQGIPPYELFYNIKFPGIYAAYALCLFLFGQSASAIHFGLLLVNVAGIWLLYRLARRFLDVPGAVAAGASYAFLSTSPVVLGLAAHATHFVVAAALAGLLLLLRGEDSGKPVLFFCSGFLLRHGLLDEATGGLVRAVRILPARCQGRAGKRAVAYSLPEDCLVFDRPGRAAGFDGRDPLAGGSF